VLAGLLVTAGVVAWRVVDGPSEPAANRALAACAAADRFEASVKGNADIDTVNRHLDAARRNAREAEQDNSRYTGLASGIEALRIALDTDDAQAARIGIDVVRDECARFRRSERGGS
jgi:hypothetical protein